MGGDALVLPLRGTWAATEAAGCGLRPDVVPMARDADPAVGCETIGAGSMRRCERARSSRRSGGT